MTYWPAAIKFQESPISYKRVVPMQPAIAAQKADRTTTPNIAPNMARLLSV